MWNAPLAQATTDQLDRALVFRTVPSLMHVTACVIPFGGVACHGSRCLNVELVHGSLRNLDLLCFHAFTPSLYKATQES